MLRFLLLLCMAGLSCCALAASSRPNIVLILADDLGWGDLGSYPKGEAWGDEAHTPTPNLDRLAAKGVRFTQAYATCMVCSPSRAALLGGQYQQRFGFYGFGETCAALPRDLKLLPQTLREAGYRTAMVGKWHISAHTSSTPLQRGFERFFGFIGGQHDYFEASLGITYPGTGYSKDAYIFDQEKPVGKINYLTEEFTDRALEFIRSRESSSPFFLYLAYNSPHPPNQAPWANLEKYATNRPGGKFTSRDISRASIENLDQNVGRIIQLLHETGLETNTIVIFTSDNGGSDGGPGNVLQHNGGLRGRKSTFYEGGIRVPLLVSWPGHLTPGEICEKPVSHLDIYPTALAAAEAARRVSTQPLDGVNLLPFIKGEKSSAPHMDLFWSADSPDHWAVRRGDWKLVLEDIAPATLGNRNRVREMKLQLFDLSVDPRESRDLAESHVEMVSLLEGLFKKFMADAKPSIYTEEVKAAHRAIIEKYSKNQVPNSRAGAPGHWRGGNPKKKLENPES